ncbi:hypothetical protein MATL_G00016860 [Megalops atlanticus]|uniref:Protein FAM53B n=1 Tax=Megalops atlanticus TaxID=7932 RepID=A0A9D3TK43_MEGAT|nr:hypothetical protein MATL_G00016860 [Megalops atlanticus]
MVIIHTKTLEKKKGVDDVTSRESDLELREQQTMMSQGTTIFSCGVMGADRWRDLGRSCAVQRAPVGASLESLWDVVPEACPGGVGWGKEAGTAGAVSITSLIRDLSLSDAKAAPSASPTPSAAPPSKRQCRSLSCSDEPGGCRSPWRPQGSRVWTSVEKRRCHSGGSVQRGAAGGGAAGGGAFPAMQRSSSFSLPARSNALPLGFELPCFTFTGLQPSSSPSPSPGQPPRPLYLSHEQICLPGEARDPAGAGSPDSTPELDRRAGPGGLARSRSQPCVLNDKKIGMKRRRPEDTQEARPSLNLAKMTQKLQNFHSLSCPGITGSDCCQSSPSSPPYSSTGQCDDLSSEELDSDTAGSGDSTVGTGNGEEAETLWEGLHRNGKDLYQLGGELDIEQIERN